MRIKLYKSFFQTYSVRRHYQLCQKVEGPSKIEKEKTLRITEIGFAEGAARQRERNWIGRL